MKIEVSHHSSISMSQMRSSSLKSLAHFSSVSQHPQAGHNPQTLAFSLSCPPPLHARIAPAPEPSSKNQHRYVGKGETYLQSRISPLPAG